MNYWAVFVAAVVSYVIGIAWYSQWIFGRQWKKLSGVRHPKHPEKSMILGFISTLIMSFVLAQFIQIAQAGSAMQGIIVAFWLWLGFVATVSLGMVIWEGKSIKLYVLLNAFELISMIVMAAIISGWA
ncbi:DUF1761 domain-containing protein [Candidatus Woesearchaeota archaeon]|nr:DUF1761 domain-containing protein [Candidatus Woesearchaeota archaeon]